MSKTATNEYVKPHGNYSKAQKLEAMKRLCREIASTSYGVRTICDADPLLPESRTIFKWLFDEIVEVGQGDKNTTDTDKPLNQLYAQAKECQMMAMGDELLSITDDTGRDLLESPDGRQIGNNAAVNRDRLKADTRKWLMSKLDRRNYGDKATLDVNDTSGVSRTDMMREAQKRAGIGIGTNEITPHSPAEAADIEQPRADRLN